MTTYTGGVRSLTSFSLASGSPGKTVDQITFTAFPNAQNAYVLNITNTPLQQATTVFVPDPRSSLAFFVLSLTAGGSPIIGTSAITASVTQTQGAATAITTAIVKVTVGNNNDAVILPTAVSGSIVYIINLHATNTITVFATGTNTIGGIAGSTGVAQSGNSITMYICPSTGIWYTK